MYKMTKEAELTFVTYMTAIAALIFVAVIGYLFISDVLDKSGKNSYDQGLVYACTYSELEIKKQLKYPDSVKFQSCVSASTSISKTGDNYHFNSYLEAKNDLGMMIPRKYVCLLTLKNTKDLEYISCSFTD